MEKQNKSREILSEKKQESSQNINLFLNNLDYLDFDEPDGDSLDDSAAIALDTCSSQRKEELKDCSTAQQKAPATTGLQDSSALENQAKHENSNAVNEQAERNSEADSFAIITDALLDIAREKGKKGENKDKEFPEASNPVESQGDSKTYSPVENSPNRAANDSLNELRKVVGQSLESFFSERNYSLVSGQTMSKKLAKETLDFLNGLLPNGLVFGGYDRYFYIESPDFSFWLSGMAGMNHAVTGFCKGLFERRLFTKESAFAYEANETSGNGKTDLSILASNVVTQEKKKSDSSLPHFCLPANYESLPLDEKVQRGLECLFEKYGFKLANDAMSEALANDVVLLLDRVLPSGLIVEHGGKYGGNFHVASPDYGVEANKNPLNRAVRSLCGKIRVALQARKKEANRAAVKANGASNNPYKNLNGRLAAMIDSECANYGIINFRSFPGNLPRPLVDKLIKNLDEMLPLGLIIKDDGTIIADDLGLTVHKSSKMRSIRFICKKIVLGKTLK